MVLQLLSGFVKIHRKMTEWEWYQDSVVKSVFIHLLLNTNFKEKQWKGVPVKRGQVVIGSNKMAEELGISRQQLRTALNKLKSTNEITIKSTNKFSLVTVVNWDNYQFETEEPTSNSTSSLTNEQPTDNQQITINQPQLKNEKNEKNEKKKDIKNSKASFDAITTSYTQNPKLISALNDFREMRKSIKAPLTDRALEIMLNKLDGLGSDDAEKILILEQSIEKSWRGVFELKERGGTSGKHRTDNAPSPKRVEETEGERLNRIALERARDKPGGLQDTECDF